MAFAITDDDIRAFLKKNSHVYSSQIELMQAAVQQLWPGGAADDGSKRLVRICLEEFSTPSPELKCEIGSRPLPAIR